MVCYIGRFLQRSLSEYVFLRFEIAIKCFDYVIDLGEHKTFFRTAKIRKLNTLKQKLITGDTPTFEELTSLKDNYLESINLIGKNEFSISSIRDLANLYAYYLHDIDHCSRYGLGR